MKKDINKAIVINDLAGNFISILVANIAKGSKTNLRIVGFEFDNGSSVNDCIFVMSGNGIQYPFDDFLEAFGLETGYRALLVKVHKDTIGSLNSYEEVFCELLANFLAENVSAFILKINPGLDVEKLKSATRPVAINNYKIRRVNDEQ